MVKFKHQTTLQFQHSLHVMLHQQMTKGVHYFVQYTRRQSIQIYLKLNKELLGAQVM